MTTRDQVESETYPVSTHPRSVILTSPMLRTQSLCCKVLVPKTCTDVAILHANAKTKTCTPRQSLHAPIQDASPISKINASVRHRNLHASPPRFPDRNRQHGGGYGASRHWRIFPNALDSMSEGLLDLEVIDFLGMLDRLMGRSTA